MKAMIKAFLPVVALMFVLNGCQAMTGETLGEQIDDTTIHHHRQDQARG